MVVYSEPISRTRTGLNRTRKISAFFGIQFMKCLACFFCQAFLENQFKTLQLGGPNAEMCLGRPDQLSANWIATLHLAHSSFLDWHAVKNMRVQTSEARNKGNILAICEKAGEGLYY